MDTQSTETNPVEQELSPENTPQGGVEGVSFPDFPETESTVAATEPQPTDAELQKETLATAHDDFDWSVDKRNVSSYNKVRKRKV